MSVPVPEGDALDERGAARPGRALPRPARGRPRASASATSSRSCAGVRLIARGSHAQARPPRRARARSPTRRGPQGHPPGVLRGIEFVDTPVYDGAALGAGAAVDGPALDRGAVHRRRRPARAATRRLDDLGNYELAHRDAAWRADAASSSTAGRRRAIVAAACERLIPPDDERIPARAAAGVADYIDGLLGAFTVDPPRDLGRRPVLGPARRRRGVRPSSSPLGAARGAGVAHPHRGIARHRRARVQRAGRRVAGAATATASPRSAPTSPPLDRDEQDAGSTPRPTFKQLLYEHACEGMYGAPEYGGNRDARGLAGDRVPRRRAAARLHRRRGRRGRD